MKVIHIYNQAEVIF